MSNSVVRSVPPVYAPHTLPPPRVLVELLGVAPRAGVAVSSMAPHLGAVGAVRWRVLWHRCWGEASEVSAEVDTSPAWGGSSDDARNLHALHCLELDAHAQRLDTIAHGDHCYVRIPRAGETRGAALWASARVIGPEITLHCETRGVLSSRWQAGPVLRGASALARAPRVLHRLAVPGSVVAQVRCTWAVARVLLEEHGASIVGSEGGCARIHVPQAGLIVLGVAE